jgi:hypothetical protein
VAKGHTYFWPKPGRRDEERKKFSALMRKVEATRLRYGIPGISCLTFGKLSRALAFMLSLRDVSESVGARDCDEVGNFFETPARKLGRTKRCARSFSRTTYDGCSFNRRFDELWGVSIPRLVVLADRFCCNQKQEEFKQTTSQPNALRLSGDTLFVANEFGAVGKYDAKTGAAISPSFITGTNFFPSGLVLSGDNLFVANGEEGMVGKYDGKTGKAINVDFVPGLTVSLIGLGSLGDSLFVADQTNNAVGEYNAKTGKLTEVLGVVSPYGIAFFGDKLFVGSTSSGTIGAYNAKTGKLINASFFTGLTTPWQIAILDDILFVTSGGTGRVGEYNAKTGEVINAAFISVPSEPVGIAVKAQSK